MLFGVLLGWILGSQQAGPPAPTAAPASALVRIAGQRPRHRRAGARRAARVGARAQANAQPSNAAVRVELGNVYFDAERFDLAMPWYEAALKLDPKNVDVSTDLASATTTRIRSIEALAQIDHSLALDPKHLKTLLNQGIVRAFGKQDLAGAVESWEKVVAIAPDERRGAAAPSRASTASESRAPGSRQPERHGAAALLGVVVRCCVWFIRVADHPARAADLSAAAVRSAAGRRPARPRPAPCGRAERAGGTLVRDPQCGTYIPEDARAQRRHRATDVQYFCSDDVPRRVCWRRIRAAHAA